MTDAEIDKVQRRTSGSRPPRPRSGSTSSQGAVGSEPVEVVIDDAEVDLDDQGQGSDQTGADEDGADEDGADESSAAGGSGGAGPATAVEDPVEEIDPVAANEAALRELWGYFKGTADGANVSG